MVVWTPKHPAGIHSHWKSPEVSSSTYEEGNMLVYSTEIKQERVINLENVYRYMHHWLKEEGWNSVHDGKGTWVEDFYGETRDQHGERELRWWWRVGKQHAGIVGGNQFFAMKWYIDVLCSHMKQIEMMYKGKKIKPFMGEFIMYFNAVLEIDINNWFTKDSKFMLGGVLSDFFLRMIYKDKIREQEEELRGMSDRFISDLKYYIGLNRASDMRKPIDQERQWL